MKCEYLNYILLIGLVSSCVNNEISFPDEVQYIRALNFDTNIPDGSLIYQGDEDSLETRGIIEYTGSATFGPAATYKNYFEHWDTVGIFPTIGDQIPFPLTTIPLGTSASSYAFQATGWKLRNDISYYAYWPFSRKNYADGNNKEHVYVKYFGQTMSKHTCKTSTGNLQINDPEKGLDSIHSQYSYMYSLETQAAPGSDNLSFSMQYVGGIFRFSAYCRDFPSWVNANDVRLILFQMVSDTDDRFILEGTYDLEDAGQNNFANIVPTKRGKSNVLSVRMDSIPFTNILTVGGITLGRFYGLVCVHKLNMSGLKLYVYDQYWNCYKYDYTGSTTINPPNTFYLTNAQFKYLYTASPDSIKIDPWDDEEETINSNWNYK